MRKRRAQPGDVYAVPLDDGTFTACQVVGRVGHRRLEVTELDWVGPKPPRLEDLEAAAPLRVRVGASGPRTVEVVDPLPPRRFLWLGSTKALAPPLGGRTRLLSDWDSAIGRSVGRLHRQPDPALMAAVRRANETRRARWDERVTVALDGEPQEAPLGCTELNVYERSVRPFTEPDPGVRLVVKPGVRLEWSQLDRLDGVHTLRYRGADTGFSDYLRRRWLLWEVVWLEQVEPRLALADTSVARLRVEVPRRGLRLELPPTLEQLCVDLPPATGPLRVWHFSSGAGVLLRLRGRSLSRVSGLERARRLDVEFEGTMLDLGRLPALRELEEFRAWGGGGSLVGMESLAAFPRLRIIRLYDFFDFDPESFPSPDTWPDLDTVEFHGLSKENAALLRRRLRSTYRLRISGARPAAWIAETRSNPFSQWLDRDPTIAKRACDAYTTAAAEIAAVGPNVAPADLDPILERFVNTFNGINRSGFIETVERDEVWSAFTRLAEPLLPEAELEARFDRWRDF